MTKAGQAQNFHPAYRVFVFGIDVTDDVLSVGVTHNDSRSPSTAEIVLANKSSSGSIANAEQDRYIVTELDIQAMTNVTLAQDLLKTYRETVDNARRTAQIAASPKTAQSFKADLAAELSGYQTTVDSVRSDIQRQVAAAVVGGVADPVKQLVLKTKAGRVQALPAADSETSVKAAGQGIQPNLAQLSGFQGLALRYPLQVGDCIFHSNDPVRIFMRDPQNPSAWFHMFAGFVSDWTDDVDENNLRTVTLRCEDVLRILRYARFSTSPGLIDIEAATTSVDLVINNTFASDDFSRLTFPEFLFSMVFGFTAAGTLSAAGITNQGDMTGLTTVERVGPYMAGGTPVQAHLRKDGVGLFSFARSAIYSFGPQGGSAHLAPVSNNIISTLYNLEVNLPDEALSLYQAVVDHQVRHSDLYTMLIDTAPFPAAAIDGNSLLGVVTPTTPIDDVITEIGRHPELYPVDGGRLFMLVPSLLDAAHDTSVLNFGFKGIELKTKTTTRLSKIYDVTERYEFSFYASPRGDILAEMPLRDFDPQDLGTTIISPFDVAKVLNGSAVLKQLFAKVDSSFGPFAPHYNVTEEDTYRWQRTFSDEHVRTLVLSTWNNFPSFPDGGTSVSIGQGPGRYLAVGLIPQFGVRGEEVEQNIRINDRQAADLYARFQFNRFNSEARTLTLSARPRMRMMPNRPLRHEARLSVSSLREAAFRVEWGEKGSMEMNLKSNYLRAWDGLRDAKGRFQYSYFGGVAANHQNYALLLQQQTPPSSTQQQVPPKKKTRKRPVNVAVQTTSVELVQQQSLVTEQLSEEGALPLANVSILGGG